MVCPALVSETLELCPRTVSYPSHVISEIQNILTCRRIRVTNLQTNVISIDTEWEVALAYRQGQAWGEATDSVWLGEINFREMIGGGECHYESWLILICTEHVIVIISIIAIVIYINRTNRQSVRTITPPPPPSPSPAPRPTYTPIHSPFNRHNVGNLQNSAF